MATKKINFTKRALDAVKAPDTGRRYVYDRRQPGLALCVTYTGLRTFYLYRRIRGRPTRVRIGVYPEITVENARKIAARMLGDIADGKDPQQQRRTLHKSCTLNELYDYYQQTHGASHNRPVTRRNDTSLWKRYLARWATRRLADIGKPDVVALHTKIGASKPYQANRALELLKKLYRYAASVDRWNGNDPTAGVKRFPETPRERFLDADELRRLFASLADEPDPLFRDVFLTLLLTGARRGNVQSMRWADVDLERGLWTIPAEQAKAGRPIVVVLVPALVQLLKARRPDDDVDYVFPSPRKPGRPLVETKAAWRRVVKRAGLTDLRMHDLRRTLGSWQAAAGASLPIIGKALGHRTSRTTEIYARLSLDPVRESVTTATDAMLLSANGIEVLDGGRGDV
ncbi:MAG: tyrosine-type recombinase/integrase [Phycisphaerae bacterium]|jgi:integrase